MPRLRVGQQMAFRQRHQRHGHDRHGVERYGGMYALADDSHDGEETNGRFAEADAEVFGRRADLHPRPFLGEEPSDEKGGDAQHDSHHDRYDTRPVGDSAPDDEGSRREDGHVGRQAREPPRRVLSGDEHLPRTFDPAAERRSQNQKSDEIEQDDYVIGQ